MNKKNLLSLFMITLFGQVFFSCNTARHYEFSNRSEAYHSDKAVVKIAPKTEGNELVKADFDQVPANLSASTEIEIPAAEPLVNLKQTKPVAEMKTEIAVAAKEIASLSKTEKKELKQALKLYKKQTHTAEITGQPTVDALELILAIFIPPLGVLLHEGGITSKFWISLLLTILFFFPGMIYSILVVTDTI